MRAFWSDPYLWVHLAGLAVVPVFLEVCLVGLAMGDPLLPGWVEIVLVAIAGIAPILWMQWQRPFSIYSLVAVALTPSQLTDDQRRILKIFKSQESRILAAIAAVVLFLVLIKVYDLSPIATPVAPHLVGGRLAGLVIAAIAFLLVNLFVQVPVSVLRALAVSQTAFADTIPYPSEQVGRDFSLLGVGVKQILPPMVMEQPRPKPMPPVAPVSEPSVALEEDLWAEPIAPGALLVEPLLDDGVAGINSGTGGEIALSDNAAIAETEAWEASESVEEIAEREGVVSDELATDASAHASAQPEALEPEALEPEAGWETSVELPLEEEAESASQADLTPDFQSEEAIAEQPQTPEPEAGWEASVEQPLSDEAERAGESVLNPEASSEEALDESPDGSDATEASAPFDMSVELMADKDVPITESDGALPLDAAPSEDIDIIEHSEVHMTEPETLADDSLVLDPSTETGLVENAAVVEQTPDAPEALAFDELFDNAQAATDSPDADVEEPSEIDAVGHDLIPEWDEPPPSAPDNEHHG